MPLRRLWVENYRSLLDVGLELAQLTVVVGENGSGKTNLYRALRLLARGAEGRLATTLLEEGGMPSILFAGERHVRKGKPVRTVIGVDVDDLSYEMSLGLTSPNPSDPFFLDPEIKVERLWISPKRTRATTLAERDGTSVWLRDEEGQVVDYPVSLDPAEPFLSQIGDPGRFPEVFALRARLGGWRFYHEFPTDATSPARSPQVGVRTPVLADDGHNLGPAITTIREIGDGHALDLAVDGAFPGSRVETRVTDGVHTLLLHQPGLLRPTRAVELSDGTLRYLCLAAALLTPRPPGLLVLNEPETGLNPSVIPPLAELVILAAEASQVVVTTHSELLADALEPAGARRVSVARREDGSSDFGDRWPDPE